MGKSKKDKLQDRERELRSKLVRKYKNAQEQQLEEQKEILLQTIEGKNRLRSVLASTSKKLDRGDQSSESSSSTSAEEKDKSSSSDSSDHMSAREGRETSWKGESCTPGIQTSFLEWNIFLIKKT
jgi:hypothetical protein